MTTATKPKAGLEDTVATSSAICYLDGDRGVLAYCGYDIHDLARHATFEEVCYLLWHRRLPTRAELGDLQSQLTASRALPEPVLRFLRGLPGGDSMDLLRTLTSALAHYDPDAADNSSQGNYRKAVRLTAQIGSLVLALLLGAGAFTALGVALSALIRSAEGSSAVVNAIYLPLSFVSGAFFSPHHFPSVFRDIAAVLPLTYFLRLVRNVMLHGHEIWSQGTNVAVIAAWGIAGVIIALRRFRWEPHEG